MTQPPRDASALLLLAGAIPVLAIGPVVARLDPSRVLAGFAARWYQLAVPALFVAAILALRLLATTRALRSRNRLAVVPRPHGQSGLCRPGT